jgi:hypothetical protein
MPLRIGLDLDGVLADFESAFNAVEERLFGPGLAVPADDPAEEEMREVVPANDPVTPREDARRRREIWREIRSTPDFWTSLQPLETGTVRRIYELMLEHRWEVFFITQRPDTVGDTAQRQSQRWLVEQGFELPSVLVLGGSRGAAAGALRLDYHVDDNAQNCVDVLSESKARPIWILPSGDATAAAKARNLGIGVVRTVGEAVAILEEASAARGDRGILQRLATLVGWR